MASRSPTRAVLTVVLAYAGFATLWILLSDRLMGLLIRDPDALVQASMLKGWFFVAVTSALLYLLVRRMARALGDAQGREARLQQEREQPPAMLAAIAEASTDAIFAKDLEGRYLLVNQATARFAGQPAEALLGRDDRALFPPEQAERLMAFDRRIRESGEVATAEEHLQTADGPRVFLATKGPLRGADGRVFGSYGIARDITERQRDEAARLQLMEDLEATLQVIPDLFFEMDGEGRYLRVKAANEALLAAPTAHLQGRTLREVLPPEAAATGMAALAAARRHGTDYGRTIALEVEGGRRHFELSVARKPTRPGEPERFVVLSRDVTERQTAEQELRLRNEALERFNRSATDRELRMVALKREVNALAQALGRPAPYAQAAALEDAPPAS